MRYVIVHTILHDLVYCFCHEPNNCWLFLTNAKCARTHASLTHKSFFKPQTLEFSYIWKANPPAKCDHSTHGEDKDGANTPNCKGHKRNLTEESPFSTRRSEYVFHEYAQAVHKRQTHYLLSCGPRAHKQASSRHSSSRISRLLIFM